MTVVDAVAWSTSEIRSVTAIFPLPADEARLIADAVEQHPP